MRCPYCQGEQSRVLDTRDSGASIRRRRECLQCGKRFTTYERVALEQPMVIKRDGRREPFDREKLMVGIRKACAKRPVSVEDLEQLIDRVEARLQAMGKVEVSSREIGDIVMEELKGLDELAYILFASVYVPLQDLESLKAEVDRLMASRKG